MQALKLLQMESQRRRHLLRSPFPSTTTEVHGNSIVGTTLSVALLSVRRVLSYTGQLLGGFFSPSKFTNENSLFRFNKTRMCRYTLWHEVKRCCFFKKQKTWKQADLLQGREYARPSSPRVMKRHRGQWEREGAWVGGWGGVPHQHPIPLSSASRQQRPQPQKQTGTEERRGARSRGGRARECGKRREKWEGERERKGSRWRRCKNIIISLNAGSLINFRVNVGGGGDLYLSHAWSKCLGYLWHCHCKTVKCSFCILCSWVSVPFS